MDNLLDIPNLFDRVPPWVLILVALVTAGVAVAQLANARTALLIVGGVFFASSIAGTEDPFAARQWLHPLQGVRSELVLASSLLLFLSVFGHPGRFIGRPWPMQSILLLLVGIYAGLLRIVHEDTAISGVASIVLAIVTLVPLIVVVSGLVDDWDDLLRLLRVIVFTFLVWTGAVAVQMLINPNALVHGNQDRFLGLLTNAQHAAVYLGMTGAVSLWLLLNDPRRRLQPLWIVSTATAVLLLIWTGSRTGAGIFAIAAAVAFYGRLGRAILLAPIGVLVFIAGSSLLQSMGVDLTGANRLTSLENTRAESWRVMLETFRENPLIGVGVGVTGKSENSYLYGLQSFGIGMGVILLILLAVSIRLVRVLVQARGWASDRGRSIIDLVVAFNLMYFAGAVLEGYLIARVSSTLVLFTIFAGIGARILFAIRHDPEWLASEGGWEEPEDEPAWEEHEPEPGLGHPDPRLGHPDPRLARSGSITGGAPPAW